MAVTVNTLKEMKQTNNKITMLTAYDYSTAKQVVEYAPLTNRVRSKDNLGEYADTDVAEWVDLILGKGNHNQH